MTFTVCNKVWCICGVVQANVMEKRMLRFKHLHKCTHNALLLGASKPKGRRREKILHIFTSCTPFSVLGSTEASCYSAIINVRINFCCSTTSYMCSVHSLSLQIVGSLNVLKNKKFCFVSIGHTSATTLNKTNNEAVIVVVWAHT